jgi:flagellin
VAYFADSESAKRFGYQPSPSTSVNRNFIMSVINTNVLSLVTQNNLKASQSSLSTSIQRLSSGLRINSAKDDAAGQAIANRFTSNIKGLTQASRNANDGVSLAQTAEGGLKEINNNLQRVRELTVQAKNGTNSTADIASIQSEVDSRLAEIDRVAGQTDFNGVKVLAAALSTKIQVGAKDSENITITTAAASDSAGLGVTAFSVTTGTLATLDTAIAKVDTTRGDLGAVQNRFDSVIANLGTTINNLSSSRSAIEDADYATEVSNMTRAQILQQAGTSVLAKANQSTQGVMALLQ